MLEIYIASIVLFGLVWGWIGKLSVDEGGTITLGELLGFMVLAIIPIVQQAALLFGVMMLFDYYKNATVFGGKK